MTIYIAYYAIFNNFTEKTEKTRDLRNFLLFDCIFITFLHITRLLLVFSQLNMVVGQLFCQLYTTVITMKCLSNNQTPKYYMQYAFCDEFGKIWFIMTMIEHIQD